MDARAAQAFIRFGLGRRGGEALPNDPPAWLAQQLRLADPAADAVVPSTAEGLDAIRQDRADKVPPGQATRAKAVAKLGDDAWVQAALTTPAPFRERLVWFWTNHFTVSRKRGEVGPIAVAFIQEAIRPHVTGRFIDMLNAVMRHPAMLFYLDNAGSMGPASVAGQRQHRGLNENLARECLELHTLSPAAGYTQADVTEFARVLTGWTVDMKSPAPGFVFRPQMHEPGSKTVMGQTIPEGEAGGAQALTWLADQTWTHRHLAGKLVRHFVADTPPPDAVRRIEGVLRDTHGDLGQAALALTRLPQAWVPLGKLRCPADYVIAVLRALDLPDDKRPDAAGVMAALGQKLLTAPLPNGWPDTAADWGSGESLLRRVDWAFGVAGRAAPPMDPMEVANDSLGDLLAAGTAEQVRRAGSRREALTLLLASPEFQRR
jgi:uncharacterized protein (DUF1800 family)